MGDTKALGQLIDFYLSYLLISSTLFKKSL